jgi:hypothetical protein
MSQTREQLEADQATLRQARVSLLGGTMVKEVRRADRSMVMHAPTIEGINAELERIDAALAGLDVATGAAKPRFRALSVGFGG